jgi:hypothetical protein
MDEQIWLKITFKKYEHVRLLKVNVYFLFMETWSIALKQMKFYTVKDTTSSVWIIIFLTELFECVNGAEFWGYVGIIAEPHFVEHNSEAPVSFHGILLSKVFWILVMPTQQPEMPEVVYKSIFVVSNMG